MRSRFIALCISLLCAATASPIQAAVSVSIGINVPVYPRMVVVPGYPVYYAPALGANFFFYDGVYWVLVGDDWYTSSWYNGPWVIVAPAYVPYYVLRVPVRYYMAPPPYFSGWQPSAPPRWGRHWGPQWEQQHRDWDRWNRKAVPGPAPLPSYQRQYSGERYPSPAQQADLQAHNYRHQPRSEAARQQAQPPQMDRGEPVAAQRRPQLEAPQGQRPAQRPQEWSAQQEPRGGGPPPRHEGGSTHAAAADAAPTGPAGRSQRAAAPGAGPRRAPGARARQGAWRRRQGQARSGRTAGQVGDGSRRALQGCPLYGTTAVTSISTLARSSISADTCTALMAMP